MMRWYAVLFPLLWTLTTDSARSVEVPELFWPSYGRLFKAGSLYARECGIMQGSASTAAIVDGFIADER